MSKQALARGLVAEIDWCHGCDVVQVHIGAVTLRLQPAVLHDLRDTLSRAINALEIVRTGTESAQPANPRVHSHCH